MESKQSGTASKQSGTGKAEGHLLHGRSGGSKGWSGQPQCPLELCHFLLIRAGCCEIRVPQGLHEGHDVVIGTILQIGCIHLNQHTCPCLPTCSRMYESMQLCVLSSITGKIMTDAIGVLPHSHRADGAQTYNIMCCMLDVGRPDMGSKRKCTSVRNVIDKVKHAAGRKRGLT